MNGAELRLITGDDLPGSRLLPGQDALTQFLEEPKR